MERRCLDDHGECSLPDGIHRVLTTALNDNLFHFGTNSRGRDPNYEAVIEYKKNREPKPTKTTAECPLLKPEREAGVHFTISETDIQMTIRLDGEGTRFLPFNKGNNGHDDGGP